MARLNRVSETAVVEYLAAIHESKEIARMSYCGTCSMPANRCGCGAQRVHHCGTCHMPRHACRCGSGAHRVYPFPVPRMLNDWSFMGLTQLAGAMGLYNRYASDFATWYVDMVCPGYRDRYESCDKKCRVRWSRDGLEAKVRAVRAAAPDAAAADAAEAAERANFVNTTPETFRFRVRNTSSELVAPSFGAKVLDDAGNHVRDVVLGAGMDFTPAPAPLAPDATASYTLTLNYVGGIDKLEEDSTYTILVHVRVGNEVVRCTVIELDYRHGERD